MAIHILQAAGDGDFLHRISDHAVFHPKAGRAARIIAGEHVYALPHQFGNQKAAAHLPQQIGLGGAGVVKVQVVCAAGVGGGAHAELAGAVAAEKIALHAAAFNHKARCGGHAFGIEISAAQRARDMRLFAQMQKFGQNLRAEAVG